MYTDPLELMREMLKHWLKTAVDPHPTWEAVVKALRSQIVNEEKVAEELESKYCSPVQHVRENTNNGSTSSPLTERSHKTPFGCGCDKCTFFSFIESGCPTPIRSASSFPYLNLSGLTREQQQDFSGRLRFESQEIMTQFQELVSATIKSFKRRHIPLDELVSHVMTFGVLDPVFSDSQLPIFRFCFKELKAADTIPKVFMILNDYFSFFNYRIIEHIVKELGSKKDKAKLQRYKEDFAKYAKRRIFECPPEFGPVSDADHADIFVKLDLNYDHYTIEQVEGFRHELSKILRVSSQGILRLCRIDEGCFQLMFQVPSFAKQEIFPLSREKEKTLATKGVISLTCGEYQFLVRLFAFLIVTALITCLLKWNLIQKCCYLLIHRKKSHHKHKLVCEFLFPRMFSHLPLPLSIMVFPFTEMKHHHDPDDDSDMGSSILTDAKSSKHHHDPDDDSGMGSSIPTDAKSSIFTDAKSTTFLEVNQIHVCCMAGPT